MDRLFTCLAPLAVVLVHARMVAQDFSVLRINEVITDNETQLPLDVAGNTTDMVEIYNSGTEILELGRANPDSSLALTDTPSLQPFNFFTFRDGSKVLPGESILVFCDGNTAQDACEPHAEFRLGSDGTEPVSLWGPVVGVDGDGNPIRDLIDQVWLPPLPSDASFGRYPDGAGPAPVPVERVLDTFRFYPPGSTTFGGCIGLVNNCGPDLRQRFCRGAANTPGGNLGPRVTLDSHASNSPAAGEAMPLRVRVYDEKEPTPPNIAAVDLRYRVDAGPEMKVPMTYDALSGVQQGSFVDGNGQVQPTPFDLWTYWNGEIPGQPAGARVEFWFRVEDAEGAGDTSPNTLCPEGIGPCDRFFGGPGCERDLADRTCEPDDVVGERYVSCRRPYTYAMASEPRGDLTRLVINEVMSLQDRVLPNEPGFPCDVGQECPPQFPGCCLLKGDVIELHNASPASAVSLEGLWLSNNPFHPQGWRFPRGAAIQPLEYLIVWVDGEGGKCPDPDRPEDDQPCFWQCPDPTDPAAKEYHASFTLDALGDQIYLFDDEEHGFGVIHGVEFGELGLNRSLSLIPDGDRGGCWVITEEPTLLAENVGQCPLDTFRRGDADSSCAVSITDAIFTLGHLFLGGPAPACPDAADSDDDGELRITDGIFTLRYLFLGSRPPPAPGPDVAGPDPTADALGACVEVRC